MPTASVIRIQPTINIITFFQNLSSYEDSGTSASMEKTFSDSAPLKLTEDILDDVSLSFDDSTDDDEKKPPEPHVEMILQRHRSEVLTGLTMYKCFTLRINSTVY